MTSSYAADDYLFIGTRGHVVAINKADGKTAWQTSLPKTSWYVVTLIVEDGLLLCGTRGHVFALDPVNGAILWKNELAGLGHGIVALCTMRQSANGVDVIAAQVEADVKKRRSHSSSTDD